MAVATAGHRHANLGFTGRAGLESRATRRPTGRSHTTKMHGVAPRCSRNACNRERAAVTVRVLTVCLGNICRSPAAAAAIREAAAEHDVDVEVDSAGTGAYHIGDPPNPRMIAAGIRKDLTITGTARQVRSSDFTDYDFILAMDRSNRDLLVSLSPESAHKVELFRRYDDAATHDEVPDPYYGPDEGFDTVIDMLRPAAKGFVASLARRA